MERKELAELINKIASHPRLSGSKNEQNAFKLIKNYIKNHIGGKTFLQKYQILTWRQKQDPCLVAGTPYTRHRFSDIIKSIWATQNTTIAYQAM